MSVRVAAQKIPVDFRIPALQVVSRVSEWAPLPSDPEMTEKVMGSSVTQALGT